jgi:uncharacterized protein (DUF433 family)
MLALETLVAEPPPLRMEEGGVIRVGQTRVSLDSVLYSYKEGCTPEEIVMKFPTLRLRDVISVIAYYQWNCSKVEAYLEQRQQEAEELQREIEARLPVAEVRERILACKRAKKEQAYYSCT